MSSIQTTLYTCLLVVLLLTGCIPGSGDSEVPSYLIDEATMTQLMVDVHILEAWLSKLPKDKHGPEIREYVYQRLLDIYETDAATFDKSMEFYLSNAHLMQSLYPQIIEILSEQEGLMKLK
jgi:hypothetical protein